MSSQITPEQVQNLLTLNADILAVVVLRLIGLAVWRKWFADVPEDGLSRYRPYRGTQARRYQAVMKSWRRLRQADPDQQPKQRITRKRLLEELRALEQEAANE
jgi:hypothetical protein